jgi:hypothetical protein
MSTTTATTLLLSPQHFHMQLKERHEDAECKTADSETTMNSVEKAPPSLKRQRSILKYRTHRDSLLACHSSNQQKENNTELRRNVVKFAKVEIREHAIIVGDNPGCCSGPPLSIDWSCEKKRVFDFEAYEASRPERRVRASMQMSKEVRIKLCKAIGYSYQDIVRLTKPVNIARAQRLHTIGTAQTHGLHESAEKITRGLKNALTFGRRKREERKFLEPYCSSSNNTLATQQSDVVSDYCTLSSVDDVDDNGDDDDVLGDDSYYDKEEDESSTLDETLEGSSEITRRRTMVNI